METPKFLSLLKNTNMKKQFILIGAVGVLLSLSVVGAYAFHTDPHAEAVKALKTSDEFLQKAQDYECQYLGQLYSDCFAHKTGACQARDNAEQQFATDFSIDSSKVCGQSEAIPPMANDNSAASVSSSSVQDPLLFGDEAGNK